MNKSSLIDKYLPILIFCLTLIFFFVATRYTNINEKVFSFEDLNFSIKADARWELIDLPRGIEFRNNGTRVLKVLVMDDPLISEQILFSDVTQSRIRENYKEYYQIEKSSIEFQRMKVQDFPALNVVFRDNSLNEEPIYQQYYVLDGSRVYLLEFKKNNFSDALLESFKII